MKGEREQEGGGEPETEEGGVGDEGEGEGDRGGIDLSLAAKWTRRV